MEILTSALQRRMPSDINAASNHAALEADDLAATQTCDGGATEFAEGQNLSVPSRRLMVSAERLATHTKQADEAQKALVDASASLRAGSASHTEEDLAGLQSMTILADMNKSNSLAAMDAVVAHSPQVLQGAVSSKLAEGRGDMAEILRAPMAVMPASGHLSAGVFSAPPAAAPNSAPAVDGGGTMKDFFAELANTTTSLKTDYLGVYEEAFGKNSTFFKAFLAATELDKSMSSTDKDVKLTLVQKGTPLPDLTPAEIKAARDNAVNGWDRFWNPPIMVKMWENQAESALRSAHKIKQAEALNAGILGGLKALVASFEPKSIADKDGILVMAKDEESAKKWAKDMGLPDTVVMKNPDPNSAPDQKWWVTLDLAPVKNMIKSLESMATKKNFDLGAEEIIVTLPLAQFQAWKVGFEAQATEIKNTSTVMAQKLSNAQSIYENLLKVLSNTLSSITDMLKGFLS